MQNSEKLKPEQIESYANHYISYFQQPISDSFSSSHLENCKYLIKSLNNLSIDSKNKKNSYNFLSKAVKLSTFLHKFLKKTDPSTDHFQTVLKLRTLSLNNLACYFKSCDKLIAALSNLEKASKLESKGKLEPYDISTTLLNLTAVLSKMGNHDRALVSALEAVRILESIDEENTVSEALTTAYFNYAVELEYLSRIQEAKTYYERAYEVSLNRWGEHSSRTQNFLDKLVEFNSTHSSERHSRQLSSSSGIKENVSEIVGRSSPDILYTEYIISAGMRFKVFFINKKEKKAVKILAVPKSKNPIFKLLLNYRDIPKTCRADDLLEIDRKQLEECVKKLAKIIKIERGEIRIDLKSRPVSAYEKSNKMQHEKIFKAK